MKTKEITMDARVILNEAITKKSVVEKSIVLDRMVAHPIHPYLIEVIAGVMDDSMKNNKSNEVMIANINTFLQLCIYRFNGKKIH